MASKVSSIWIYSFWSNYSANPSEIPIFIESGSLAAINCRAVFVFDVTMTEIIDDQNSFDSCLFCCWHWLNAINSYHCLISHLQVKSGKTEKLPTVAGKGKDARKSAPAAAKPVVVAEPVKIEATEAKAVKVEVAAKPAPKKRGVVAKAAAATGKGRVSKPLRGKGLKKKKIQLRFTIDCTNIAEDSIMDVADFVSSPFVCSRATKSQLSLVLCIRRRSTCSLTSRSTAKWTIWAKMCRWSVRRIRSSSIRTCISPKRIWNTWRRDIWRRTVCAIGSVLLPTTRTRTNYGTSESVPTTTKMKTWNSFVNSTFGQGFQLRCTNSKKKIQKMTNKMQTRGVRFNFFRSHSFVDNSDADLLTFQLCWDKIECEWSSSESRISAIIAVFSLEPPDDSWISH